MLCKYGRCRLPPQEQTPVLLQIGLKYLFDRLAPRQKYTGGIFFVSEYGGIGWSVDDSGWSYGQGPKTEEEFKARFKALTDTLLDNPYIFGMCYTQLTNVEQEQNGLYTYDRRAKFDPAWVASVVGRKAAIEEN